MRLYWPAVGFVIGLASVLTAYFNMNLLVGSGNLSLGGALLVTAEYVALLSAAGWLRSRLAR